MPRARRLVLPALAGLLGCQAPATGEDGGDESSSTGAGETTAADAGSSGPGVDADARYTYWRDTRAIVDRHCATCHRPDNIAPFSLVTADDVVTMAPILRAAVEDGTMPPWPPSADCNVYSHDRSLPAAERDVLFAWLDDGAPLGDPADAPPAEEGPPAIDWDLELAMPEAYVPRAADDDYRCFVVDWPLDVPKFVTGFDTRPDQTAIVHHVIAYLVPPNEVAAFHKRDADEDGAGYTCFGSPGGGFGQQWLGAWAPGAPAAVDPDRGILVEPGSAVVLQLHYHPNGAPAADRTSIALKVADEVRYEQYVIPYTNPEWLGGSMRIPAGEKSVVHDFEIDLAPFIGSFFPDAPIVAGEPYLIHTASLHMHTRGTRASITVERKSGDSECALYIPRWDFDWQGGYKLQEALTIAPGDRLRLACEWDNSPENQPIVDGQQVPPKDIFWGEGTGDEMCLAVLTVSAP